jgi:hypothetical protein
MQVVTDLKIVQYSWWRLEGLGKPLDHLLGQLVPLPRILTTPYQLLRLCKGMMIHLEPFQSGEAGDSFRHSKCLQGEANCGL